MHVIGAVCLFLLTACFALLATWIARAVALRLGIVDHPNSIIPQHTRPVAYLGGVGILAGLLAGLPAGWVLLRWCGIPFPGEYLVSWRIILFAAGFVVLGLVDDLTRMRAEWKLVGQLVLVTLAASLGIRRPLTGIRPVDIALSAFWILLLVNAFNVTDVCDGLVGGIAVVAFLFLGWYGDSRVLPVAAAGACAGFLWFNAPPATIFLGDAGSHLLGFLAAVLTLSMGNGQPVWPYAAQVTLILGVPLFEVAFLIAVRARKGLPWWRGSPDHFSLRLQAAGLNRLKTDLIAWAASAVLCAAALGLGATGGWAQGLLLGAVVVGLAVCWRALLHWDVTERPVPAVEPEQAVQQ